MKENKQITLVGSENWRSNTLKLIKLAQDVVGKSDKNNNIVKTSDPLPNVRSLVASLSNSEVRKYTRDVRVVVSTLRKNIVCINEEIISLTRGMEALEKSLEHIRKDIKLNIDSHALRLTRPNSEKVHDGGNDLLNAERAHLLNSKKSLEAQLYLVQQHLKVLDNSRKSLLDVLRERSSVLDLLCHNVSPVARKTGSQPVGLDDHKIIDSTERATFCSYAPDALGPYTPETDQALQHASETCSRSSYLRNSLRDTIDQVDKLQKAAHQSVNDGLTMKVLETEVLRGPIMSGDLLSRERLSRPMVKVFHRHPGTQLPEAKHIIKSGDGLLKSLTYTSRNIGLMMLTNEKLYDDIRNKRAASSIDSSVIRMRRQKSDHRWTVGNAF